jgi:twitching motility protein PilT
MTLLANISFQNLILEADPTRAKMQIVGAGKSSLVPVTHDLHGDLRELFAQAMAVYTRDRSEPDFLLTYSGHRYRVALIREGAFALRRTSSVVPSLAQCRFHPRIIEHLLSINSGTVFVFGEFSSGKTTAVSSFLAAKVKHDGSLGVALEDPSELPLEGEYGQGRIYQISVSRNEIESRAQDMMRTNFSAMMFSELRSPMMSYVFLQAGLIGRLLMTTGHASNIIDGLRRVVSLASALNTGGDTGAKATYNQLADGFQAAILMKQINGRYSPSDILLRSRTVKACLLNGDLDALQNSINLTKSRLQSNSSLPLIDD